MNDEDYLNLNKDLFIAKGCRVYINNNIMQQYGLYNGAIGTVESIIFDTEDYKNELPKAVIVRLDECDIPKE